MTWTLTVSSLHYVDVDAQLRRMAIANLWKNALTRVRIRYPDPRVDVQTSITAMLDYTEIAFIMFNLVDTGTPDKQISGRDGFIHRGQPAFWPGYPVALQYISTLWGLYLLHEGQELVTVRGTSHEYVAIASSPGHYVREYRVAEIPVIDPHGEDGANQKALAGTGDIASTLDWGVGFGNGKKLVENARERASLDVQNEIEFLAGRVARWE